jgi:hypothetical protein
MRDLELLQTPLAKLRRLRLMVGACTVVATCLGSYFIVERSSAYLDLVSVLKQQRALAGTEQRLRKQDIEEMDRALRQQAILHRQQQQLIEFLRAIGLTRTPTTYYTEVRTDGDNWRLYGSAREQQDVFLLMAQLGRLLPDSVVTLQHVSGNAPEASSSSAVTFEIFAQPATG